MIRKTGQNNIFINPIRGEKSNQDNYRKKDNVLSNINSISTNTYIPPSTCKAVWGIKEVSFGKNIEESLKTLNNITYGMNYLLDPNYKIKVIRGEKNLKILNFYQKKEDIISKIKNNEMAYGICNDLAAAYAEYLRQEHPDKLFVVVYDATAMQYAVVHYYIAAFDRTEKNIHKLEDLNAKDNPIVMKNLSPQEKEKYVELFKDALIIDPSVYQYGKLGQGEFADYYLDKLISLNMIDRKAKEYKRDLTFTYGRPLMLGSLEDFLNNEEWNNLKQILTSTKKYPDICKLIVDDKNFIPKSPGHRTGSDLAIMVGFEKNNPKVEIYISKYGDTNAYEANEIRDCLTKDSKFSILLNKLEKAE